MGSYGSTRWGSHSKRTTVEESLTLNLATITRSDGFGLWSSGRLKWSRGETVGASIAYTVRPEGKSLVLVLRYVWTPWGAKENRDVELPVRLEQQPMRFGGVRWWGRCPLQKNDRPCNRRVGKLYSPSGSAYFGCRVCFDLTYQSARNTTSG